MLVMTLLLLGMAKAQTNSSDCMEQVKKAFDQIDHSRLMQLDSLTEWQFHYSYITRTDPEKRTFEFDEEMVYGKSFYLRSNNSGSSGSDASEAFHFKKDQFTVYRTKPNLNNAGFLPAVDAGIWKYGTVVQCDYVPAPGQDNNRHKHALVTINAEGQKKYKVTQIEYLWDPISETTLEVTVSYTPQSLTTWAKVKFGKHGGYSGTMKGSVQDALTDEKGELKGIYGGSETVDYR